tara:strand:- start:246 stop:482 length:237 start_codon:yes stop_codon:yes gene_type:complete
MWNNMDEFKIIRPLLVTMAIALAFLFIAATFTENNCGCGGDCECSCKTVCSRSCECGFIKCKGGEGDEYLPEEQHKVE